MLLNTPLFFLEEGVSLDCFVERKGVDPEVSLISGGSFGQVYLARRDGAGRRWAW